MCLHKILTRISGNLPGGVGFFEAAFQVFDGRPGIVVASTQNKDRASHFSGNIKVHEATVEADATNNVVGGIHCVAKGIPEDTRSTQTITNNGNAIDIDEWHSFDGIDGTLNTRVEECWIGAVLGCLFDLNLEVLNVVHVCSVNVGGEGNVPQFLRNHFCASDFIVVHIVPVRKNDDSREFANGGKGRREGHVAHQSNIWVVDIGVVHGPDGIIRRRKWSNPCHQEEKRAEEVKSRHHISS
mmetsp:Transcript_15236/g.31589  ORF Transcript_15236/g.31589 Transcript_15236/m.31589 type:complete len:241 (+) Transcript_15236:11-733(+)